MPFDVISYVLAKRLEKRMVTRPVRRADLEYPTENVSFAYLAAIGKVVGGAPFDTPHVVTLDDFADKAVFAIGDTCDYDYLVARFQDGQNMYISGIAPPNATSDHRLLLISAGTATVLASEAVDLGCGVAHAASCSGSTIKSLRWDVATKIDPINPGVPTATISATDTTFASGAFGSRVHSSTNSMAYEATLSLLGPLTRLPSAAVVADAPYTGSGTMDDPYRPSLPENMVCTDITTETETNPRCTKADGSEGRLVNQYAVTWGAFEFKPGREPTVVVVVTGARDARALDALKTMQGVRTFSPPKSYSDAVALYKQLRQDHPEWLAGKDNLAYHTLGHEALEPLQAADFYAGFLIDHRTRPQYDQLKRVPDWEMRRTINMWINRLRRVKPQLPPAEADKHEEKLRRVLRLGW